MKKYLSMLTFSEPFWFFRTLLISRSSCSFSLRRLTTLSSASPCRSPPQPTICLLPRNSYLLMSSRSTTSGVNIITWHWVCGAYCFVVFVCYHQVWCEWGSPWGDDYPKSQSMSSFPCPKGAPIRMPKSGSLRRWFSPTVRSSGRPSSSCGGKA